MRPSAHPHSYLASPFSILQGSGKGTQSSRLLKRYDLNYISAGDVLRQNIAERTEVGKQADQVIQAGGEILAVP